MARSAGQSKVRRSLVAAVAATLALGVTSACSGSSGPPTLNWFINPDNGAQAMLAQQCTAASGGKYRISTTILPNDASQQRQQLVTRLSAKDSSIDLMSLDPVFVAEFAEAGFLQDVPAQYQDDFKADIVAPAVKASTWKGKLVAAPFWANTQLLWYRKSLAEKAGLDMSRPVTWAQIIKAAQGQRRTIGVQASQYEGYTVWINSLIAGAGGQIVDNPGAVGKDLKLGLNSAAGRDAADVIGSLARAGVGGPALSSTTEPQSLALFEAPSTSMFMTIWPYVWAAMATDKVSFRDSDVGWTYYPETVAGRQSKPPFGGIELGVGAYGSHQADVFDAVKCIRNEAHQREYMLRSGNPAANTKVYDDQTPLTIDGVRHTVRGDFPMADYIVESLKRAAPRPQTQYYGDLSTALQEQFSPPSSVTASTPKDAAKFILEVLKGEKLL